MTPSFPKDLLKQRLGVPRPRFYTGLALFIVGALVMWSDEWLHATGISLQLEAICMLLGVAVFFAGVYLLVKARTRNRAMRICLWRLEEDGMLEQAAAALDAPSEGSLWGQCHLAGGFLIAEEQGLLLPAKELGWLYLRYTGARRLTLLGETYSYGAFLPLVVLPKNADSAEGETLLRQAEELFPEALIGYSKENKAAWKERRKAWEEAELAAAEEAEKAAENSPEE